MKSKYIIVRQSGSRLLMPFVFSDVCTHSDIARAVGGVVVGAGFCVIVNTGYYCYGESLSCQVKSNGDVIKKHFGVEE